MKVQTKKSYEGRWKKCLWDGTCSSILGIYYW